MEKPKTKGVSMAADPPPLNRRDSKSSGSMEKFRRMSRVASMAFGMRRMSRFPTGDLSSGSSRLSQFQAPMLKLENSYRLEPAPDDKFDSSKARKVIQDVLTKFLKGQQYNPKNAAEKTQRLSEAIRREMKDLGYHRYKIVVHAIIGQNTSQGVESASQCLGSPEFDTWAHGSFNNSHLFGVVTVYAVYQE